MFTSKYDPEAEENGVEDSLAYVSEKSGEVHVSPQTEPFQRHYKPLIIITTF